MARRFLCLLIFLLPRAGLAETLEHVRVDVPDARTLAQQLERSGYDVLEGSVTDGSFELVVTPAERSRLTARGLALKTIAFGRPFREIQAEGLEVGGGPPPGYPDLGEVVSRMSAAADSFPSICRLVDLTTTLGVAPTIEGRHLFAVVISDDVSEDEDEPAMLVVSAHHCREIVTPVIALHAVEQLTSRYGVDPAITAVVDDYEIWIAPVWNPDGYEYVFTTDNLWRKNRRVFPEGVGVDLNRNYPHGWDNPCSGSDDPGSQTYKGPSAASEAETQTMTALTEQVRFTKVLDYHSAGREVLHGYACWTHPFDSYLEEEAIGLATAAGYEGEHRSPSADGEHYEWQLGTGTFSFLMETFTEFQPPIESAEAEAALVWPGTLWMLERPIPLWGHVTAVNTGAGLEATISFAGVSFPNGETNTSHPATGRYHAFLPDGIYDVIFEAEGYLPQVVPSVAVSVNVSTQLDVALEPAATAVAGGPQDSGLRLLFADPLRRVLLYEIARPRFVELRVFDVRGARVATLVNRPVAAGRHREVWSGLDDRGRTTAAGTYFYRLEAAGDVYRGKFVQVR